MALFSECMPPCARKTLDTADIVRDGDLSPTIESFRVADHSGVNSDKRHLSAPMQTAPLWVRAVEADFHLAAGVAGCRFYSCCWPVVSTMARTSAVMWFEYAISLTVGTS